MQSPLGPCANSVTEIDSSVFIYGARRIREGKILYKDFFDHKGPILYLMEVIGLTISNGSNIGIWIVELSFMISSLCILYKISRMFSKKKLVNVLAVILSIIPICTFLNEGNYAEEYALPFMLYSLYIFLKFIKNNDISKIEVILSGLFCGLVLFLKMNLLILWIVYIPVVICIYIKNKRYKELIKTILLFILGMLLVIIPVLIYFLVNNALSDFIYCVFTFNFKYAGYEGEMPAKIDILKYFLKLSKLIIIAFIVGLLVLINQIKNKQKYLELTLSIAYFIIAILELVLIGRDYSYYGIMLIPALIVPFTLGLENIRIIKNIKLKMATIIIAILILGIASIENILVQFSKIKMTSTYIPKQELINYIKENTDKEDNILILWNACTYYNLTDRKYDGKYMYQIPLVLSDDKILKEFIEELQNNKPDLIIYPYEYKGFQDMLYTYDDYIDNIKMTNPEFLEDEATMNYINNRITDYLSEIKNINIIFTKIEQMTKDGIYTKEINDTYTSWKLN